MTEEGTEKQMKILKAITEIHRSIGVKLDLEEVSRTAVQKLLSIVGCAGCALLQIDGRKVRILAERGFSKMLGGKDFSADMPAIKHIVNTKKSICTGDISNSIACGCVPDGCSMTSLICTPVVVKDEVRGIIHLDSPKKNAFDEQDSSFVKMLAEEIAIAMERSFIHSQVKASSLKDGLTGCFNRRKLDQDIETEIVRARRYERPLSLLMIDVDWFKNYNDFHGHLKGDELLKKMVRLFERNMRASDTLYRYGGEEFTVLLPETAKAEALFAASKLQKVIEKAKFEGEKESQPDGKVTVSIGVASYPWDGNDGHELLRSADSELYRAKQIGRNKVCAVDMGGDKCDPQPVYKNRNG